jgi:hypothetical protein
MWKSASRPHCSGKRSSAGGDRGVAYRHPAGCMLARCGRNARSPRKRQRRRTARAGSHRGVLKHGHLGESRRCGMTAEHSQAAGSIREAGCLRPAGELPRLQYRYPPLDPTTCHFIRDGLFPCRFISRLSPAPDPDFSLSRLPQSLARSRPDADLAWHRFAGLAGPVFPALYAVYGLLSGGPGRRLHPENIHRLGIAGALATWRVTQGIYCFDSDLAEAIADTPRNGELPADLLFHLPEWCVYIETPGRCWRGRRLYGCVDPSDGNIAKTVTATIPPRHAASRETMPAHPARLRSILRSSCPRRCLEHSLGVSGAGD